jgi:hypothetical protein
VVRKEKAVNSLLKKRYLRRLALLAVIVFLLVSFGNAEDYNAVGVCVNPSLMGTEDEASLCSEVSVLQCCGYDNADCVINFFYEGVQASDVVGCSEGSSICIDSCEVVPNPIFCSGDSVLGDESSIDTVDECQGGFCVWQLPSGDINCQNGLTQKVCTDLVEQGYQILKWDFLPNPNPDLCLGDTNTPELEITVSMEDYFGDVPEDFLLVENALVTVAGRNCYTNESGECMIENAPLGNFSVKAIIEQTSYVDSSYVLIDAEEELINVELELNPEKVHISGYVRDVTAMQHISGANVVLRRHSETSEELYSIQTSTDYLGFFEFFIVPSPIVVYTLEASKSGYASDLFENEVSVSDESGYVFEQVELLIPLAGSVNIYGNVLDNLTDEIIADAIVKIVSPLEESGAQEVVSDADGNFEFFNMNNQYDSYAFNISKYGYYDLIVEALVNQTETDDEGVDHTVSYDFVNAKLEPIPKCSPGDAYLNTCDYNYGKFCGLTLDLNDYGCNITAEKDGDYYVEFCCPDAYPLCQDTDSGIPICSNSQGWNMTTSLEICDNHEDDDGDGYVDCLDEEDCLDQVCKKIGSNFPGLCYNHPEDGPGCYPKAEYKLCEEGLDESSICGTEYALANEYCCWVENYVNDSKENCEAVCQEWIDTADVDPLDFCTVDLISPDNPEAIDIKSSQNFYALYDKWGKEECFCGGAYRDIFTDGGFCCPVFEGNQLGNTKYYPQHYTKFCNIIDNKGSICGIVKDLDGTPLNNVVVNVYPGPAMDGASNPSTNAQGKFCAEVIANVNYEVWPVDYKYELVGEPAEISVAKNQEVNLNLLMDFKSGLCSQENGLPVENLNASHVLGKPQVELTFSPGCPNLNVTGYLINKSSQGNNVEILIGVDEVVNNTWIDDSEDLLWTVTYVYDIVTIYQEPTLPSVAATVSIALGDSNCSGVNETMEQICVANSRKSCTDENKLIDIEVDLSGSVIDQQVSCDALETMYNEPYVCVKTGLKTKCVEQGVCSVDRQGALPFGLFYERTQCVGTNEGGMNYCYYDYTDTSLDKCFACSEDLSCYDYRSEEACNFDLDTCSAAYNTGSNKCEWLPITQNIGAELGKGFCYQPEYEETDKCDLCSVDGELFKNTVCDAKVCQSLGDCYSQLESKVYADLMNKNLAFSCTACNDDVKCSDYKDVYSCTGVEEQQEIDRLNNSFGLTGEVVPSNDACDLGTCKWNVADLNCFKDSDDNDIDDCLEYEANPENCEKDNVAPNTIITSPDPELFSGYISMFTSFTFKDADDLSLKDFVYCVGKDDDCAPTTHHTQGFSFKTATIDVLQSFKHIIDEQGVYYLRYYSKDIFNNVEVVNSQQLLIDPTGPEITVTYNVTPDFGWVFNYENGYQDSNLAPESSVVINVTAGEWLTCSDKLEGPADAFGNIPLEFKGSQINNEEGLGFYVSYSDLYDGWHSYTLECYDYLGNAVTLVTPIYVDAYMLIAVIEPQNSVTDQTVFDVTIETDNPAFCYYKDGPEEFDYFSVYPGNTTHTMDTAFMDLQPNTLYYIDDLGSILCEDLETNAKDSTSLIFGIDNSAPITNVTSVKTHLSEDVFDVEDLELDLGNAEYYGQSFYNTLVDVNLDCVDQPICTLDQQYCTNNLTDGDNYISGCQGIKYCIGGSDFCLPDVEYDLGDIVLGEEEDNVSYFCFSSYDDYNVEGAQCSQIIYDDYIEQIETEAIINGDEEQFIYYNSTVLTEWSGLFLEIFLPDEPYPDYFNLSILGFKDLGESSDDVDLSELFGDALLPCVENLNNVIATNPATGGESCIITLALSALNEDYSDFDTVYVYSEFYDKAGNDGSKIFPIYLDTYGPTVNAVQIRANDSNSGFADEEFDFIESGSDYLIMAEVTDDKFTAKTDQGENNTVIFEIDNVKVCEINETNFERNLTEEEDNMYSCVVPFVAGEEIFLAENDMEEHILYIKTIDRLKQTNFDDVDTLPFVVRDTTPPVFNVTVYRDGEIHEGDLYPGTYFVEVTADEDFYTPKLWLSFEGIMGPQKAYVIFDETLEDSVEDLALSHIGNFSIYPDGGFKGLDGVPAEFEIEAMDSNTVPSFLISENNAYFIDTLGPEAPSLIYPSEEYVSGLTKVTGYASNQELEQKIVLQLLNSEKLNDEFNFNWHPYNSEIWDNYSLASPAEAPEAYPGYADNSFLTQDLSYGYDPSVLINYKQGNYQGKYIEIPSYKRDTHEFYYVTEQDSWKPGNLGPFVGTILSLEPSLESDVLKDVLVNVYKDSVPEGWFGFELGALEEGEYYIFGSALDENMNKGEDYFMHKIIYDNSPIEIVPPEKPLNGTVTRDLFSEIELHYRETYSDEDVKDFVSGLDVSSVNFNIKFNQELENGYNETVLIECGDVTYEGSDVAKEGIVTCDVPEAYGKYEVAFFAKDKAGNPTVYNFEYESSTKVPYTPMMYISGGKEPYNYSKSEVFTNDQTPSAKFEFEENVEVTQMLFEGFAVLYDVLSDNETYVDKFQQAILEDTLDTEPYYVQLKAKLSDEDKEGVFNFAIRIDTEAPDVGIDETIRVTNSQFLTVTGTVNDSNVDMVKVSGDVVNTVSDSASLGSYEIDIQLKPGSWYTGATKEIYAEAEDKVGNVGTSLTKTVTVDITKPILEAFWTDPVWLATETIFIGGNTSDNNSVDEFAKEVLIDIKKQGAVVETVSSEVLEDGTFTKMIEFEEEGEYQLEAFPIDDAGNIGDSIEREIEYDMNPPAIKYLGDEYVQTPKPELTLVTMDPSEYCKVVYDTPGLSLPVHYDLVPNDAHTVFSLDLSYSNLTEGIHYEVLTDVVSGAPVPISLTFECFDMNSVYNELVEIIYVDMSDPEIVSFSATRGVEQPIEMLSAKNYLIVASPLLELEVLANEEVKCRFTDLTESYGLDFYDYDGLFNSIASGDDYSTSQISDEIDLSAYDMKSYKVVCVDRAGRSVLNPAVFNFDVDIQTEVKILNSRPIPSRLDYSNFTSSLTPFLYAETYLESTCRYDYFEDGMWGLLMELLSFDLSMTPVFGNVYQYQSEQPLKQKTGAMLEDNMQYSYVIKCENEDPLAAGLEPGTIIINFTTKATMNETIIISPENQIETNNSIIMIEGSAELGSEVAILYDVVLPDGTVTEKHVKANVASGNFVAEIELPKEGYYTITALAEDVAGNTREDSITIYYDNIGPEVEFSIYPPDGSLVNGVEEILATLIGSVPEDLDWTSSYIEFIRIKNDENADDVGVDGSTEVLVETNALKFVVDNLAEGMKFDEPGEYKVRVVPYDFEGHIGGVTSVFFSIDPNATSIIFTAPEQDGLIIGTNSFLFTGILDPAPDYAEFTLKTEDGMEVNMLLPFEMQDDGSALFAEDIYLENGVNKYFVSAQKAGHIGKTGTRSITVDIVGPQIQEDSIQVLLGDWVSEGVCGDGYCEYSDMFNTPSQCWADCAVQKDLGAFQYKNKSSQIPELIVNYAFNVQAKVSLYQLEQSALSQLMLLNQSTSLTSAYGQYVFVNDESNYVVWLSGKAVPVIWYSQELPEIVLKEYLLKFPSSIEEPLPVE